MQHRSILLRNTTYNIASYAYIILVAIFYIPILLNNLGTSLFGLYAVFASIPQLVSSLDLGLTASTIKHLASSSGDKQLRYWQSSFALFMKLGLALSALTFSALIYLRKSDIFRSIGQGELALLSATLGVAILLDFIIMHLITLSQAQQRFETYNVRTLIVGSNGLVAAIVSIFSPHLSSIFLFRLLTRVITLVYLHRDSKKYLSFPKNLKTSSTEKNDLLDFGLKNFVGKAINQLQAQYPKYLLLNYLSPAAVAIYSVPLTLVQRAAGMVNQLSLAFFPFAASESSSRKENLRVTYISAQLIIAILAVGQIFVIKYFARPLLIWWLQDPSLVESILPILTVLSYSLAFMMLTPLPSALFDGLGYPQITSIFATVTTIIEVVTALSFITYVGILSPAYASLFSLAATTPFLLLLSLKYLDTNASKVK